MLRTGRDESGLPISQYSQEWEYEDLNLEVSRILRTNNQRQGRDSNAHVTGLQSAASPFQPPCQAPTFLRESANPRNPLRTDGGPRTPNLLVNSQLLGPSSCIGKCLMIENQTAQVFFALYH